MRWFRNLKRKARNIKTKVLRNVYRNKVKKYKPNFVKLEDSADVIKNLSILKLQLYKSLLDELLIEIEDTDTSNKFDAKIIDNSFKERKLDIDDITQIISFIAYENKNTDNEDNDE